MFTPATRAGALRSVNYRETKCTLYRTFQVVSLLNYYLFLLATIGFTLCTYTSVPLLVTY